MHNNPLYLTRNVLVSSSSSWLPPSTARVRIITLCPVCQARGGTHTCKLLYLPLPPLSSTWTPLPLLRLYLLLQDSTAATQGWCRRSPFGNGDVTHPLSTAYPSPCLSSVARLDEVGDVGGQLLNHGVVEALDVLHHALVVLGHLQ